MPAAARNPSNLGSNPQSDRRTAPRGKGVTNGNMPGLYQRPETSRFNDQGCSGDVAIGDIVVDTFEALSGLIDGLVSLAMAFNIALVRPKPVIDVNALRG